MRRISAILLCIMLLGTVVSAAERVMSEGDIDIGVPSAVLMEKTTGTVIYEKNAHEKMSPASVTKVMTMLLVTEELEAGRLSEDTPVTASGRAASMGGSQIYLEEGETMTAGDMLKSVAVSSANDCSVALAEHIAGTEDAFVSRMNARAKELGLENTQFTNCTGLLESDKHLTTAYDIAVMSRELIQHDFIKEYTSIWMDTVRGGDFGLSNTNRLIFYYPGATGLKTGFTQKAMFCLSATAEREGVEYIAVVLKGSTSEERFESAKTLLNYAFANYTLVSPDSEKAMPPIAVELGTADSVQPVYGGPRDVLLQRSRAGDISHVLKVCESIEAPVHRGQSLGVMEVVSDGKAVAEIPIIAGDDVPRKTKWQVFTSLIAEMSGV